jgi:YbgC/YbaW family acyl-CoA thioester hydrolase
MDRRKTEQIRSHNLRFQIWRFKWTRIQYLKESSQASRREVRVQPSDRVMVRRQGNKLCTTYKVRGYHIDTNDHVNNAVYLNYLEDARDDFLEFLGLSVAGFQAQGVLVFLSEVRLKYHQPAVYGDWLDVWGWLSELRRVKSTWKMEIRRAGAGELLTEAWMQAAFLDVEHRILPIPSEARALLETIYAPTG